mmetsp:Transcript_48042/g.139152  ORF Transcript_48042/g.139152 Transcript_48042/m.139152 type:complete len:332 (-) Transcript_48042:175-1170(-)
MSARGRLLADENPYRSLAARRGNPADVSPYRSNIGGDRNRLNPADQSPYRSTFSPASRGAYNSADESPYRSQIGTFSSGSSSSLARRRARPPPLETVTPISPVAPMTARKTAPGREASPATRKAVTVGIESTGSLEKTPSKPRSPSRPLDMGPAEVRLHAENAQAIARLHAEHSQRIAQLLMGTIECRPADLEGHSVGPQESIKVQKSPFALCGGCCGADRDRKALNGGPSPAALQARRAECSRLNALHAQALAKQESLHQRQKALLQVDTQRKELGTTSRQGAPLPNSSPMSPTASPKPAAMNLGKTEPRRAGLLGCCGRGQQHDRDGGG